MSTVPAPATTPSGLWPKTRRATSLGIGMPVGNRSGSREGPAFRPCWHRPKPQPGSGSKSLWFADHFSFQSDAGLRGAWDAWTLMAAIAAAVPDVQIGPMVACTGYRNPGRHRQDDRDDRRDHRRPLHPRSRRWLEQARVRPVRDSVRASRDAGSRKRSTSSTGSCAMARLTSRARTTRRTRRKTCPAVHGPRVLRS